VSELNPVLLFFNNHIAVIEEYLLDLFFIISITAIQVNLFLGEAKERIYQ